MQLINSRYRIEGIYKAYEDSTIYKVYDLWNYNRELLLKFFSNNSQNAVLIQEFTDIFIDLSNLKHKHLISNHSFEIVSSIDNKPVKTNQYFFTTDFVEENKLTNYIGKLNLDQIINITYQLLGVVSYLSFRGHHYRYINPDNIFVIEDGENFLVKLNDFAEIRERISRNFYDEKYSVFVAPEVKHKQNTINISSDTYSIGMLLKSMLIGISSYIREDDFKVANKIIADHYTVNRVNDLIMKLVNKDQNIRLSIPSEIVNELNNIFGKNFKIDLMVGRNELSFKNRIIGRDKETQSILDIDNNIEKKFFDKRIISFIGEEGIGKTRFLQELSFKLRMKGRIVYYTSISETNTIELGAIINILKKMIKECDNKLIDKYGSELVKIIPEISDSKDIKPSSMLSGTRERLRLYDRITNFIIENIKNIPTYIIIDDLHNSDIETINLINYLINNNKQIPLLVIASYDRNLIEKKKALNDTVNSWISLKKADEHKLLRFNLEESAEAIKNILGMSYRPINFSTKVIYETIGNPGHIEEAIKNLVATGELFINENGNWDSSTKNYTTMYIPSNIGEAIKSQVKLLDKDLYNTAKYVSIFNTSVSRKIINILAEGYGVDTDNLIDKLVTMKILDERVEDWGYTYSFYSRQIKSVIYTDISNDEKNELHRKAAEIIEEIYLQQDRGNIDELIYHYNMSMQTDKAIKQTIIKAKEMKGLAGNLQSIHLWEKAYEFVKNKEDIDKLEVVSSLGSLYMSQGMTSKSINCYEEGMKVSKLLMNHRYEAICYNGLSSVFLRKYDMDLSEQYANKAKSISEEYGYMEELLDAVKNLNRISISKGEYDSVLESIDKYLDIAIDQGFESFAGQFYNHKGIIKAFTDQIDLALGYFLISLEHFRKSGDYVESTRALNNIGSIYSDYYDDMEMAMNYYREGLDICQKYQSLESEANFLNNIGELYIRTNSFTKAKDYIEKVENIARDIEDESLLFLSQMNLCLIYLSVGEYDKCYNYYEIVKKTFKIDSIEEQHVSRYYSLLSEFYLTFGAYNDALEYVNKTIANSKILEHRLKLDSELKKVELKYLMKGEINKADTDNILKQYKSSNYNGEKRKSLLLLAKFSILVEDVKYAEELLLEDEKLMKTYSSDFLDATRDLLRCMITKDYNLLNSLLYKVKDVGFQEIEFYTNIELGDICFDKKYYYKSVNYYLAALDMLYRITKKIPEKGLQVTFIKKNSVEEIKQKLNKIVAVIKGNDNVIHSNVEFSEDVELEDFFNIKATVDLFNEDIFNIEYRKELDTTFKGVNNFEELIQQFNNDYKHNLDVILKYAVNKTFANRGLICIHDDETDELITLTSTPNNSFILENKQIISEIKQKSNGILINKFFDYDVHAETIFVPDNIKAIICMPIFKSQAMEGIENLLERRKEYKYYNHEEIIGYLYLDTDKLFNKFDNKRFKLIDTLSHLLSINIDNYMLEIISSVDKMTGAYTRKYFDTKFNHILSMATREAIKFSVIMLDIDRFKNVNDTFGHRKGDEVLSCISKIILENVRESDIVGRYGGEEFIIILPNTSLNEGRIVAEKIRTAVEKSILISNNYTLTISLGLSSFPEHGQTADDLIEKADQALYKAKESGRNRSVVWRSDIGESKKRLDKLAGIISGNTVQDQRFALVMVELIGLLKEKMSIDNKVFRILGRLIEIFEAEQGVLIILDENKEIEKTYKRLRFSDLWVKDIRYNEKMVQKAIASLNGEFFIDWEDITEIDPVTGKPNWQSVIIVPLINSGSIKGVLQITVPIKEKEFDYNSYNFVNTIGDVIAAMF